MKTRILALILLLAPATTFVRADNFEGVVDYDMTASHRKQHIQYYMKGENLRWEMEAGKGHRLIVLYDHHAGDATMLMPEQSMYMVFPQVARFAGENMPADADVEETGRTETILGYPCHEYMIHTKRGDVEVWATGGLGRYVALGDLRSRNKDNGWTGFLAEKELFPLRIVTKDRRGREISRMEATSVEKKALDDAMFAVPEGYRRMPGIGDLLRGRP